MIGKTSAPVDINSYELISEITVNEDVNRIRVEFPESVVAIMITGTFNLTSSDWIYLGINDKSTGLWFTGQIQTITFTENSPLIFYCINKNDTSDYIGYFTSYNSGGSPIEVNSKRINAIHFYCYNNSTLFTTGTAIKVYKLNSEGLYVQG